VGLSARHDRAVTRGSLQGKQFSVFYYRKEELVAVDSINRPGDQMAARRLIAARISPSPEQAADTSFDLKLLLKPAGRASAQG
jgi:3-phenylpropionate/trans-cinnamate dioxygenase ferredoxin reductase subunit